MIIEKTGILASSKSFYKNGLSQTFLGIIVFLAFILLFVTGEFDNIEFPLLLYMVSILPAVLIFINGIGSIYSSNKSKKINYEEGEKSIVRLVEVYGGRGQQFYVGLEKEWFCRECGASIGSQMSKFCPECGKSLLSTNPESEDDVC
jgi:hypothetical protein